MLSLSMLAQLLAGVALFLYGMKMMSEGMEKAAGARLRKILDALTKNRLIGVLVGIGFTMIIQSSSATTVMVVSFVNAGLMNLMQATGLILGANIGTTITAWLVALKLTAVAPVLLTLGVIMVMFMKKTQINRLGIVLLGFGMLFFGMSVMGEALEPLKSNQELQSLLISFDNPFMSLLIGILVTCVFHSSSATVGLLQVLALQLDIPISTCVFIVLGCNIGTCVDALLAALAGNKNAKRAALIHLFFNVFGSGLIALLLLLPPVMGLVERVTGAMSSQGNAAMQIANAHSLFKIFEVLVFFPLTPYLVRLVELIIRGDDMQAEDMRLRHLNEQVLITPPAAVHSATLEAQRMAKLAADNLMLSLEAFSTGDREKIDLVKQNELVVNFLNHNITDYLVKINQLEISPEDAAMTGSLFHIVNDVERIGDHAENMAEYAAQRFEERIDFSQDALNEIDAIMVIIGKLLYDTIALMDTQDESQLPAIKAMEETVDDMEEDYQQRHVDRLTRGECTPIAGMVFGDILSNLERVADHACNIAFLVAEKKTLRQKTLAALIED